jgi:DNA polymerase-1
VDETVAAVRRVMEAAASPAVALDVPLVVDAGAGATWAAAH